MGKTTVRATKVDPATRFPRGAEVIERLRLAGYVPGIAGNRTYIKKGPYNRDKVAYAQWIDELRDPVVSAQAKNYIRLTEARRRRWAAEQKKKGGK